LTANHQTHQLPTHSCIIPPAADAPTHRERIQTGVQRRRISVRTLPPSIFNPQPNPLLKISSHSLIHSHSPITTDTTPQDGGQRPLARRLPHARIPTAHRVGAEGVHPAQTRRLSMYCPWRRAWAILYPQQRAKARGTPRTRARSIRLPPPASGRTGEYTRARELIHQRGYPRQIRTT
jgi:hypothetical protein